MPAHFLAGKRNSLNKFVVLLIITQLKTILLKPMKKPLLISLVFLFSCCAFAQELPRNTVSAAGIAQKTIYPKNYKVRFALQEDVTSDNGKVMVKTSLDSLETFFFQR